MLHSMAVTGAALREYGRHRQDLNNCSFLSCWCVTMACVFIFILSLINGDTLAFRDPDIESHCDRHSISLLYISGFLTTVSMKSCHIRSIEQACSGPRWGCVNQTQIKLVRGAAEERWDPGVQSAFFKDVRWWDFFAFYMSTLHVSYFMSLC